MNSVDDAIKKELMAFYQKQFGYKWSAQFHRQLVPSPFRFLSVVYSVPIDYVYSIYNQLVQQFKNYSSVSSINASL
jgi:hypothetical protein